MLAANFIEILFICCEDTESEREVEKSREKERKTRAGSTVFGAPFNPIKRSGACHQRILVGISFRFHENREKSHRKSDSCRCARSFPTSNGLFILFNGTKRLHGDVMDR